jgi:thioredoxin reductase
MTNICNVRRKNRRIEVTYDGHTRRFPCAIIASGTEPKVLEKPGLGSRALSEIYPIRNVRNKRIAIIGAGDAAFDFALNLSRKNRVTILCRDHGPRALPLLVKRARATNRIVIHSNCRITSVRYLHNCTIVQMPNGVVGQQRLEFDYVVTAIGRRPALGFLSPSLRRTYPRGIPGMLYFAGDVRAGHLRQTAIAVGDGVKVAMQAADSFQEDKR